LGHIVEGKITLCGLSADGLVLGSGGICYRCERSFEGRLRDYIAMAKNLDFGAVSFVKPCVVNWV